MQPQHCCSASAVCTRKCTYLLVNVATSVCVCDTVSIGTDHKINLTRYEHAILMIINLESILYLLESQILKN